MTGWYVVGAVFMAGMIWGGGGVESEKENTWARRFDQISGFVILCAIWPLTLGFAVGRWLRRLG